MWERNGQAEPDPKILAELSALADGSLASNRADDVRERIARSSELRERYERERQAVLALRELHADQAPAALRFAIEKRRHRAPTRRRRALFGGLVGAATAVAVVLMVLLLPGGAPGAPTVSQAAALALRGAAQPAPGLNPRDHLLLSVDVEETYFPNWNTWFGWRAVGQRVDRLGGKLAVTVFYRRHDRHIAYTILATPPLQRPASTMMRHDGIELQSFTTGGRLVVTWRRDGHTCVLSGSGVPMGQLATLAGWRAP